MAPLLFLVISVYSSVSLAEPWLLRGKISSELRLYSEHVSHSNLPSPIRNNLGVANDVHGVVSLAIEPEWYRSDVSGDNLYTFKPFVRYDSLDDQRSHFDIRELNWLHVNGDWEFVLGISKVYWGVTESVHLVDVINQTDLVEDLDGEEKLGQPMLKASWSQDWGIVDLFLLPYFRERSFIGINGRNRSVPNVDINQVEYESAAQQYHVDWSLRWFNSFDDYDVGLSYFHGTNRQPSFRLGQNNNKPVLLPFYQQMQQLSLDFQATKDEWLYKVEAYHRSMENHTEFAAVLGFEYSQYGVFDSYADLGYLFEYLFNDGGESAGGPFQNDVFLGLRYALNDEQSSEILAGAIIDLDHQAVFYNIEASRRLGDTLKISVNARVFSIDTATDPLYQQRRDSFIQLELAYYL